MKLVVGAILPVPEGAPAVVLEARLEFLLRACYTVPDHPEALLAAALEELVPRRLEMEAFMGLESAETSVEREEALGAEPEAPMQV